MAHVLPNLSNFRTKDDNGNITGDAESAFLEGVFDKVL